jgi:hypothetical protein
MPHHNTMKFEGLIGIVPIFALIDNGSTHSFVNLSVLQAQKHAVTATIPMIVMVVNEDEMVTDSKCDSL